jgi:hypothetical protein
MLLKRAIGMLILSVAICCAGQPAEASEVHGQVFFRGLPTPGAVVTVTRDGKSLSAVTDRQGLYEFPDLADGVWKIRIEMRGFAPLTGELKAAPDAHEGHWELKMLALDQVLAEAQSAKPEPAHPAPAAKTAPEKKPAEDAAPAAPQPSDENAERSADSLMISGSENNAATSQYALSQAFGNRRPGSKALYNGSIGAIAGNSIFDARPYSLSGLNTPKSSYAQTTLIATLGGPLRIPHLLHNGPNFFVAYQWTRNNDAVVRTGLVPDAAERSGNLSGLLNSLGQPVTIYNPATGLPFTGAIPVSSQAAALLKLYPAPNLAGSTRYNYQAAVLNDTHADALQSRLNKTFGRKDQLYGGFGFRSQRANSANLFDFIDTTNTIGIDTNINWSHRYRHQVFVLLGYHFTRQRTEVQPNFVGRENVSALAGITGNDQDPADWGPPNLSFSSGIAALSDAESAFNRNRTDATSINVTTSHRRHNFTFGGDFRRQEFNELGQTNPRGSFGFTGAATQGSGNSATSGSDLADFLVGVPDSSALAYGNADKYFRQSVYDLFFTDDWRLLPNLSINAGMRWDYGAPLTELKGRLVNLDIGSGFKAVAPVLATSPKGPVTGTAYPSSLVHPDKHGFEPRIGLSWRPMPASTLVVRAGYGIADDTSVYLSATEAMAQQAPLSTSLSVANSSTCPLTLANGFPAACAGTIGQTFALDPNLRVGYVQNWQLSVQRDLPWALVMSANYLGTKGTHGMQQILPNSYALGETDPCPSCTSGYVYRTSGGNSSRNAVQLQLRRRLRSGFTASVDYTWAKAIDDDAQLGGQGHANAASTSASPLIAQNWLNPRAERSRSSFDQRQLLNAQLQYTTGMGMGGRTLMSGWRGRALKEWTVTSQISAGSGLPETPVYIAIAPGTAVTGTIRPILTGASIYQASAGYHLNAAAFSAPTSGAWGTAARNSINGPDQFTLNGAMSRTFRLRNPFNLDVRVDATNLLNHVAFTGWNSTVNSTTFGLPASAGAMRSLQLTGRLRF